MSFLTLRRFNNVLSAVVIVLSLYVLLMPFLPQVSYRWQKMPPLAQAIENNPETVPQQNTLVIPKMKLQQTIHEGKNKWTLNEGVWHIPKTGSPDAGGNMVLSGHRFTYGGPAVFYHMDLLKEGDDIVIYWQQKKHRYRVEHVLVVPPSAKGLVDQTPDEMLTIYTCTPLVTAKNRLIIQAKPIPEVTP